MRALINIYSHYSYRKRDIGYLIRESYFVTWEKTADQRSDTRYVTKAGCIPIIYSLPKYEIPILFASHAVQSTVRIMMSRDMVFTTWALLDIRASPLYKLANGLQVQYIL
jgi:hypothetical protein